MNDAKLGTGLPPDQEAELRRLLAAATASPDGWEAEDYIAAATEAVPVLLKAIDAWRAALAQVTAEREERAAYAELLRRERLRDEESLAAERRARQIVETKLEYLEARHWLPAFGDKRGVVERAERINKAAAKLRAYGIEAEDE